MPEFLIHMSRKKLLTVVLFIIYADDEVKDSADVDEAPRVMTYSYSDAYSFLAMTRVLEAVIHIFQRLIFMITLEIQVN